MSYYRQRFSSFEEFQREGLRGEVQLGKEEYELLEELEAEDLFFHRPRRRRSSYWD